MSGARVSSGPESKQDYETPWEFMRALEKRFGKIGVDLAATRDNAKAADWIPPELDSLTIPWASSFGQQLCFLNPPFKIIGPWAKKCYAESRLGLRILFLTPASVDSKWFDAWVHKSALVLAVSPRIQFEGASDPYPKPLMVSCFNLGQPGFDTWRWK